ncbi:MAG: carboxypeptidase-like regulatory domain-containing protein [Ekhidna sp.]
MKATLTTLFILSILAGTAQTTFSGKVTDQLGEPLLGVNVYLKGTYDGATTGIDGAFSFSSTESDSLVLVASYIGFHETEISVDGNNQFIIELKEAISQLNAVVITAGSFDASDDSKRVVLKSLDIVTTAGATADIPGALNTLPGTQTVGETGRLFVRGGEGRETKTYIDGMIVHNEYSPSAPNTPGRSRFSPFMFKGMSFSTGGYSAEYGQALSSALILQSKDLAAQERTDISLMTVGADLAHTSVWGKSSFSGKVQYTNLTPYFELVSQNLAWDKAPTDYNGNFAYRLKTSKTGLLKFYTNLSSSSMELYEAEIANPETLQPVTVSSEYVYFNTSYRELLTEKWGLKTGISVTESKDFASRSDDSRKEKVSGKHGKLVFDYTHSDRINLTFGGEVLDRDARQNLQSENDDFIQNFRETITAGFVETEAFASSSLAFKLGVRMEHNSLTNSVFTTPRLSAAYKTGEKSQVSVAYGKFYQTPENQLVYTSDEINPEVADHYIANYQWSGERRTFRVEGYYKKYDGLIKYNSPFDGSGFSSNGDGHAKGIDVFWRDRKTFKNMDYWVSYSYLDTERNYKNYPGSFAPPFASNHNVSVVVKKFVDPLKSQLGFTYSLASPRKYNDLNSDGFMGGETPLYHDLSFNISYLYSSQVIIHAMVNNVFGINNIYGYEYADAPNSEGFYANRAITPPAKRFIFLGIFITLSKDKSINQLPNL